MSNIGTSNDSDDEQIEKRQIGPRIEKPLANDLEFVIRKLHDGKYKGRLSDEVSNAFEFYIGKIINENAEWIDESESKAQANRLEEYAERHREACASVPVQNQVTEELSEMRDQLEEINNHNTRMLSQIVTQLDE
jgi:hypothetical protein